MRKTTVALCALVFLGVFALISQAEEWGERADGGYYRVVDLEGKFLTVTALELGKGDLYIDAENQRYVIDHFNGDTAVARHDGKERMPVIREAKQSLWAGAIEWAAQIMGRERVNRKLVGIYHTHGDECYTPTSGTESRTPRGDIYEVGAALAQALEKEGYEVQHSWDTFVPHDGQAYLRSRRTASELSKSRPQTMIDVHRDAVPDPQEYRTQVSGQPTSRVRLVVGRQNHLRDTNLAYAKRIKAIADEKFPNLVHGIFHAKGNYNQDLGPRMILLEVGTHTTTLAEAKRAAQLMASVIPAAAGMAPGTASGEASQTGRAALTTFWWVLGLAIVGGVAWVFLNKEGASRLLRSISSVRAGGVLGAGEPDKQEEQDGTVHGKRRSRLFGRRRW